MDILLSTDKGYIPHTCVLMTSIGIHNSDVMFHLLLTSRFSLHDVAFMMSIAHKYGNEIEFYNVPKEFMDRIPDDTERMSKNPKSCYSRLFVTEVLPPDIHKILYLDGDIIVRGSLLSLFEIDLDGYSIGAVEDRPSAHYSKINWLPYDMNDGYFNSGVLLMNLDYLREHISMHMYWDFFDKYHDIQRFHDQDVLNTLLHDSVLKLPLTYNFQKNYILKMEHPLHWPTLNDEIEQTKDNPLVIHYNGVGHRPWLRGAICPYLKVWRYYFRQTGMKEDELPWIYTATEEEKRIAQLRDAGIYTGPSPYRTDIKDLEM